MPYLTNDTLLNLSTETQTITTAFIKRNYSAIECGKIETAVNFLDRTRQINLFATIGLIIIGLIGNTLAVIVFIQKRFRLRSPGVYLLCLAISDGTFLLTHFFEDTLRTYIDVYIRNNKSIIPYPECNKKSEINITASLNTTTTTSIFLSINITDQFEISCRLVNYLRYVLRFVSAYIITIFTIQRAIAIYFPLWQNKFSSTVLAWKIVIGLIAIATTVCLFVPFLFKLNEDSSGSQTVIYCDTNKNSPQLYFVTTIVYIALIMFIPITTIIICNSLIIFQICRAGQKRKLMFTGHFMQQNVNKNYYARQSENSRENSSLQNDKNYYYHASPNTNNCYTSNKTQSDQDQNCGHNCYCAANDNVYMNEHLSINQRKKLMKFQSDSQKVTRMLIIMSLSYAILNLPYFITWCMFYHSEAINSTLLERHYSFSYSKYLFGFINITEIFYVLNYSIHFFLYCASGRQFRKQLKFSIMSGKKKKHYI
jgi:hypothetical protein